MCINTFCLIGSCWYDNHSIQKINRDTMRRSIICAANSCYSSISCHYDLNILSVLGVFEPFAYLVLSSITDYLTEYCLTTGAISSSNARFKKLQHSISSMWTSSINNTPGAISAFPSSLHSETKLLQSVKFVSECNQN